MYLYVRYISKYFILNFALTFIAVGGIVFTFDYLELLRNAHNVHLSGKAIAYMAILKNYHTMQKVLPFIALLTSVFTFIRLNTGSEIIAMRTCGISMTKIITAALFSALFVGILNLVVLHPLGSRMFNKFTQLENKYLKNRDSKSLSLSDNGLWLSFNNEDNLIIVNARKIDDKEKTLGEVNFYFLTHNMQFRKRLVCKEAQYIEKGKWLLKDVLQVNNHFQHKELASLKLRLPLKFNNIMESMAPAETLSILKLFNFIQLTNKTGLPAQKYLYYFYKTLLSPIFLMAMALIGSLFAIEPPRTGRLGIQVIYSIILGFILYFTGDIIFALGLSGRIPLLFASLLPSILTFLIGSYILLHRELHN